MICPECKQEVDCQENNCSNCGYPIRNKKRSKKVFILVFVVLLVVATAFWLVLSIPLWISNSNYNKAQTFEYEYEFDKAIVCYNKVIEEDEENFNNSTKKIKELTKKINANNLVCKAYIVLKRNGYVTSFDMMDSIMCNEKNVSCYINGVGYAVGVDVYHTEGYSQKKHDSLSGYSIVKYKAPFKYNGWLTTETNSVMRIGTDALFDLVRTVQSSENIELNLCNKYIELYEMGNDVSFFDLGDE